MQHAGSSDLDPSDLDPSDLDPSDALPDQDPSDLDPSDLDPSDDLLLGPPPGRLDQPLGAPRGASHGAVSSP